MNGSGRGGATDGRRGGAAPQQGRVDPAEACHRHQVLAVGSGLVPSACAGFLEQAGMDPVLAPAAADPGGSDFSLVTIWHPGLVLLERIGLRRPVERLGTPIGRLESWTADAAWERDAQARPALVALRRDRLRAVVARHLHSRLRTVDRPVTDLEATASGVRATVGRDVEEEFDAVATTAPDPVPDRDRPPGNGPVDTWEFEWPSGLDAPPRPASAWAEGDAVFATPVADGTHVRLVSDSRRSHSPLDVESLGRRFAPLFEPVESPFADLEQGSLHYGQSTGTVPRSLHDRRIALLGPAARAPVPGSWLGTALGIEDAWVLADELAYGPPDVEAAFAAYERRRRRRGRALQSQLRTSEPIACGPTEVSHSLRRVCAARSLAYAHVVDGTVPDIGRTIPDRH